MLTLSAGGPLGGEQAKQEREPQPRRGKLLVDLFPAGDLYPVYLADQHRPGFGLVRMWAGGAGIADSGSSRFNLKLGASFGLVRVRRDRDSERAWQLGLIAGLDAVFDLDRSYDNIGWDGNYGLVLTVRSSENLAWKIGALHTSSHIGDEYAERTGRRRIGYTREEVLAGLSWRWRRRWRAYAEGGWGYVLRNEELQEPARAQTGLEYEREQCVPAGRWGCYAAVDVSATEELGWRRDVGVGAGLSFRSAERLWRIGVELSDGRPPLGEFFQDRETHIALGLWMDL